MDRTNPAFAAHAPGVTLPSSARLFPVLEREVSQNGIGAGNSHALAFSRVSRSCASMRWDSCELVQLVLDTGALAIGKLCDKSSRNILHLNR